MFANDAVTKSIFLRGGSHGAVVPDGRRCEVLASARTGAQAGFTVEAPAPAPGRAAELGYLDLVVMAAVAAIAQEGRSEFSIADVLGAVRYANPRSSGMAKTVSSVAASLAKMASVAVELEPVRGSGGKEWLPAVARAPIVSTMSRACPVTASSAIELVPAVPDDPASALPLFKRACDAGQVIGLLRDQVPDFGGRRVSLAQRQAALYLAVRALERGSSDKVLVDSLFRDVGIPAGTGAAGRQARSRAIAQLTATLDAMAAQGTVISGYEVERSCGRIRAVLLARAGS